MSWRGSDLRRHALALTTAALLGGLALTSCGSSAPTDTVARSVSTPAPSRSGSVPVPSSAPNTPGPAPDPSNPLSGQSFFVYPQSHAAIALQALERDGKKDEAATIARIADQPTAVWFAGNAHPGDAARRLTQAAAAAGRTAVLVVYDVPQRDCGLHSAGGAPGSSEYLDYVRDFAGGIDGRTVVILEPDALALAVSGCAGIDANERFDLLGKAVDILQARQGVKVYIDAGNPSWITDLGRLADALQASGVKRAAGFALNVSNYETTASSVSYGDELSDRLGGAHYVIDTSRNGAGPVEGEGHSGWCNPPGRKLGSPPTSATGTPRVDALLWVKQPGDSDGQCGPEQPPAGVWWPEQALSLAR